MELIELIINEDFKGVEAVSVVENPAIELDFVALNKQKVQLAEVDKEKRILMGAALVPNKKIYRVDESTGEEYYVFFSENTVRQASEMFFKNGYQSNTTEEHEIQLNNNTVVESWIKEDEVNDKSVKFGLEAPVGTWFISLKVEDEETYQKAKDGTLKGFSIEGYFASKVERNDIKDQLKAILLDL